MEFSSSSGPLVIETIIPDQRTFYLIQDTHLSAGTKQRGIKFFHDLKDQGFTEVVTYGTVYGYGQVATAWCCSAAGLKCTIFLPLKLPRTKMTLQAFNMGANIRDVYPQDGYTSTSQLATEARAYARQENTRRMIELGLDDPGFINALAEGIKAGNPGINPKRIWVAGGSGVLSRSLAKAFPGVHLCVVQVGRYIYPDSLEGINYTIYTSTEKFRAKTEFPPPYVSLMHYDAKVWKFAIDHGTTGDFIWNVK